jgi:hypothetical protein
VTDLTRAQPLYTFSSPLKTHDGRRIENEGHNAVTSRNGQFYTVYHVAKFTSAGAYAGRDVYISPVMFKPDGTMNALNLVTVRWTTTPGSSYTIDVRTTAGIWISGCLDAATVGTAGSFPYNEVCTSAADRVVHKYEVSAFRVNQVVNGVVVGSRTLSYDGYTDDVTVP